MIATNKIHFAILLSCLMQLAPICWGSNDDLVQSWHKINTINANDIQRSNEIYNKIRKEQGALEELRVIVEKHLRTKNAEILVNAIHSNHISSPANNLKELLNYFNTNYSMQMVESIFAEAINEIILTNKLTQLPDILWNIYERNDGVLFESMLRAQLQLFNTYAQKSQIDARDFIHLYAYRLYKIKQEPLYSALNIGLKLKVQKVVDQLPQNLRYLYFMPYFCLSNSKYLTYIYTAIEAKVDPLSRYIWLWRDTKSMDDTCYIKAEVGELTAANGRKLSVALKGIKYQMYYYMMPTTLRIAGWDSTDAPTNDIWDMELLGDNLVRFNQNDYLMCAVENHDGDRRNVGGLKKSQDTIKNPDCQWRMEKCSF